MYRARTITFARVERTGHRPALVAGALLIALVLGAPAARSELLCDCAQIVDSCSASVGLDGAVVDISSDTEACSRVDYLVEGQPFTALVVGGQSQLAWPGLPRRNASIVVENCRVCAEAGSASADPATSAATEADANPDDTDAGSPEQPIIKVLPDYPRTAWMNRLEGDVVVEYTVTPAGNVSDLRVVRASSPVFEVPAIDAVTRFRFRPAEEGEAERTGRREEFRFRLVDGGTRTSVSSVSP